MKYPRMATAVILYLWSSLASYADDGFNSGNHWLRYYKRCAEAQYSSQQSPNFHDGYCLGQTNALTAVSRVLPDPLRFCMPEGGSNQQAVRIIVSFLKAHPERLHEDVVILSIDALHQAWPCKG